MDPRKQPSITGYRLDLHCGSCGGRIELKVPLREGVQNWLYRTGRKCDHCGETLVSTPPVEKVDE